MYFDKYISLGSRSMLYTVISQSFATITIYLIITFHIEHHIDNQILRQLYEMTYGISVASATTGIGEFCSQ